jgi:hypothetical protein
MFKRIRLGSWGLQEGGETGERIAMKSFFVSLLLLFLAGAIHGQEKSRNFLETIEDNSFLIEEAYNQEPGVVQHIFNVVYGLQSPKDLSLGFTQEWPVFTQTHQLSYTVPAVFLEDGSNGLGDVLLNYRYQLFIKTTGPPWRRAFPSFFPPETTIEESVLEPPGFRSIFR